MNGQLTLDEVLDAGLPAFGGDLYQYSPTRGFFRAATARLSPPWLPVPWPAFGDEVVWRHEDDCACPFCARPATQPVVIQKELEVVPRDLARTA